MKRLIDKIRFVPKKVKVLLCVTSLFIAYITFAEIDIASPGEGIISGVSNRLDIVSPASGFINVFNIKTGDSVEKDQVLFSYTNLDAFHQEKTLSHLVNFANERISDLEENKKLLNSILNGIIKSEVDFFSIAKNEKSKSLSAYKQLSEYLLLRMEILNLSAKHDSQIKELNELQNQIKILKRKGNLLASAGAPEIEKLNNNSDISRTITLITTGELNAQGLIREMSLSEKKYTTKLISEIQDNEDQLNRLKKEMLENNGQMELLRNKIRANSVLAPTDGVVLNIEKDLEKGSYVEASNLVMVLKKHRDSRVIEAKVLAKYRPFIAPQLPVKIVVNSPGFKKIIRGTVTKISADSFADKERMSQERFYSVQVTPEQETILSSEHDGLPVMVYISSKKISVFSYLTALIGDNISFNVW
ncbi:TPA: HlyD family efflux transporter periplasmic adaptor subunit [Providencia rettgeri]|uniref:HlyD family efflux transporter periplasmic adaptor subunit n=1 Tax=Providencia sp. PROV129 TaxID=2949839 RepID=UPI002349BBBD|nr:HlyD family efflux transporter periplasmic adaptor subunit [Providencia rettgeri]